MRGDAARRRSVRRGALGVERSKCEKAMAAVTSDVARLVADHADGFFRSVGIVAVGLTVAAVGSELAHGRTVEPLAFLILAPDERQTLRVGVVISAVEAEFAKKLVVTGTIRFGLVRELVVEQLRTLVRRMLGAMTE